MKLNPASLIPRHWLDWLFVVVSAVSSLVAWQFAQVAASIEPLSWQCWLGWALVAAYAAPVVLPRARRCLWPESLAAVAGWRPAALAYWFPVSAIIVLAFLSDSSWKAIFSARQPENRHRQVDRFAQLKGLVFGWRGRRAVYSTYALTDKDRRRDLPEAEWAWAAVVASTPEPCAPDDKMLRLALRRLGLICQSQRKFSQSLAYFQQLRRLCEADGPAKAPVRLDPAFLQGDRKAALSGIANALIESGNYQGAIEPLARLLEICEQGGDQAGAVTACERLADLYITHALEGKAEPYARKALEFSRQSAAAALVATSPHRRAHEVERYAEACERYSKVVKALGRDEEAAKYGQMSALLKANAYQATRYGD